MPKIVFLPHQDLCPDGIVVEAETGETILDAALRSGIEIEHAWRKILCLAPPATASCVKVLTRWRKVAKMKTTCWIKPGGWNLTAV